MEREAEIIQATEGLDEETKKEKIMELKRLMDAELIENDEDDKPKNNKLINFDYTKHSLEVEKDFTTLAINVAGKLKAENKGKFFLAFLKKLNLAVAKDFNTDMQSEIIQNIQLIKNKKKKVDKKVDNKKDQVIKPAPKANTNVRMDMDVNVEVNPDYKPRNHQMYEDFM